MLSSRQQLALGLLGFSKVNTLGAAAMGISGKLAVTWMMLAFSVLLLGTSVFLGVSGKGDSCEI